MAGEDATREVKPLRTFTRDARRALRCWSADPRLPLVSLGFAILGSIWGFLASGTGAGGLELIGAVVFIFFIGFHGTQRVWYVHVDRGSRPDGDDLWRLTRQLRWRFLRLGALSTLLLVVPVSLVFYAASSGGKPQPWMLVLQFAVLDVVLTFATVTMAFYDSTAWKAVRHSLIVIRQQWPTCAWYVFVPALTLQLVTLLPRGSVAAAAVDFVASLVVAMVALVIKGATVLFYSDRYPTLDDPHPSQARTD